MKKATLLAVTVIFLISCATPGRVCGGKGGQRCVEITKKSNPENYFQSKRNS